MKRIKLFASALVLSLSSVFTIAAPRALAASIVWEGDVSSDATDGDNWAGGSAPTETDVAVFPSNASNRTVEFPSAVEYGSISFTDDGAVGSYTFEGTGPLTLNSGIVNSSGSIQYIEVPIVLAANQTFDMSTNTLEITGTINLGTFTLTIDNDSTGSGLFGVSLEGAVSGSGGITKEGTGILYLYGDNTYTGATVINSGRVIAGTTTAFGTTASGTTVADGAMLQIDLQDDVTFAEPLTLAGSTTAALMVSDEMCFATPPYTTLTLTGAITLQSDIVVWSCAKNVKITGAITGAHSISLDEDSTGTIEIASSSNGSSTPNGILELEAKTTEYKDNSPSTSITVKTNETAVVTGTYGSVTVNAGGTLKGTGTVGLITVYGAIAPGLSPGCLTSTGGLTMQSGSSYEFELGGTTACDGYDQIKVTGSVQVGGELNVSRFNNFVPTAGQKYVIIDNDGTDAVMSTFDGLAEGATFEADGVTFSISYVGGDGNDVELTVTAVSPDTGFALLTTNPYVTMALMLGAAGGIALIARSRSLRPAFAVRRRR